MSIEFARRAGVRLFAFLLAFAIAAPAWADYLEVRRDSAVKRYPESDSEAVSSAKVGAYLDLLDNGKQVQGYYHVADLENDTVGWVYRTLVRRYPGRPPGEVGDAVPRDTSYALEGDLMRVHFIAVGQGNATLIEFSCGAVLIDAGGQTEKTTASLVKYLDDFFERRTDLRRSLDTVFVTHTHVDHNRALKEVIENFTVKNYVHNGIFDGSGRGGARWMRDHANDNGRQIAIRDVSADNILALTKREGLTDDRIDAVKCSSIDPRIRILHGPYDENPGWTESAFDNGNNKGVVIRVDYGATSFLFPGDLEEDAIDELVAYYKGTKMLDVDVYMVGHHGSYNGTTEGFLRAMTPEMAVVSMSRAEDHAMWTAYAYGHPREQTMQLLSKWVRQYRDRPAMVPVASAVKKFVKTEVKRAVYGTGWDGTVIIEADGNGRLLARANNNVVSRPPGTLVVR